MTLSWLALSIAALSTAVWVGAIVFQSAIVAPSVFTALEGPDASKFLRRLFPSFFRLGIVCGAVMTAGFAFLAFGSDPGHVLWPFALGVLMTVAAVVSLKMVPGINAARDAGEAGAARFERLHRLSVLLTVAVLVAGIVVLGHIARLGAAGFQATV